MMSDDARPGEHRQPARADDPRSSPSGSSPSPARSRRIVERPLPVDDPKVRQPDITRARTLLGWEPKVPLDEGLPRTLAYFRQQARRLGRARAAAGAARSPGRRSGRSSRRQDGQGRDVEPAQRRRAVARRVRGEDGGAGREVEGGREPCRGARARTRAGPRVRFTTTTPDHDHRVAEEQGDGEPDRERRSARRCSR